jgi:hypothetical protein
VIAHWPHQGLLRTLEVVVGVAVAAWAVRFFAKLFWRVLGKPRPLGSGPIFFWYSRLLLGRASSPSCCILLRDLGNPGESDWSGHFGVRRSGRAQGLCCIH